MKIAQHAIGILQMTFQDLRIVPFSLRDLQIVLVMLRDLQTALVSLQVSCTIMHQSADYCSCRSANFTY